MAEAAPGDLATMAEKGRRKYTARIPIMHENYAAAKNYAIASYEALPFGPTRKRHYRAAWDYMPENYRLKVTPRAAEKWYEKWIKAMSV